MYNSLPRVKRIYFEHNTIFLVILIDSIISSLCRVLHFLHFVFLLLYFIVLLFVLCYFVFYILYLQIRNLNKVHSFILVFH